MIKCIVKDIGPFRMGTNGNDLINESLEIICKDLEKHGHEVINAQIDMNDLIVFYRTDSRTASFKDVHKEAHILRSRMEGISDFLSDEIRELGDKIEENY